MSLHFLYAHRFWRVLLRTAFCAIWLQLPSGCMLWRSPVTKRVADLPSGNSKVVFGCTNVTYVAPQDDVSTRALEMQHRIDELTELLTIAYAQQFESQQKEGQLQSMEKKAKWSDALAIELRALSAKTEALNAEITESKNAVAQMSAKLTFLHSRTNELEMVIAELTGKLGPIEDTMRTLRIGNYEYYTIHPGDTCKSIAAQPYIYGDEARHTLIRQANREQVSDLDNLTPGEVLIIPRLKGDAIREF